MHALILRVAALALAEIRRTQERAHQAAALRAARHFHTTATAADPPSQAPQPR